MTKEFKRTDKCWEQMTKTRYYKLKFIDSAKFMAISLSNLVDNLAEGIQKMKCKRGHVKTSETCGTSCKCCLEYTNAKD